MFWKRADKEKNKIKKEKQKEAYERVYRLHKDAQFLCYINEAYMEDNNGESVMKLEGSMSSGAGTVQEKYDLYDCKGRWKAELDIEEFYIGGDSVEKLVADDKRVAIYPKQQNVNCVAGDILCKSRRDDDATDYE